jgi:hypothetical protein
MSKNIVLIAAAALCCLFPHCDNPANKDSLSWYSTVDIPINIELRVGKGVDDIAGSGFLVDMSSSSFTIEEVFLIKKLRKPTVEYKIEMDNKYTNFDFVFYAIFAPQSGGIGALNIDKMSINEVFDLIKYKDDNDDSYFSIFGTDNGFKVGAGETKDTAITLSDERLVQRVLSSPSISWRWLAEVRRKDLSGLDATKAIDTRFRLRVRGISNLDSLFTL